MDAIADVLRKYVHEPEFLMYGDTLKSSMQMDVIKRHYSMLRDLGAIAPNYSFQQVATMHALAKLAETHPEWGLVDELLEDWKCQMARRLRTMCRHLAQVMWRPKKPRWYLELSNTSEQASSV